MLSISSITSLPGQISLEKESPSITRSDRNPHLSTQSCPNSPRRMPKSRAGGAAAVVAQSQLGSLGSSSVGVSPTDVMRLLEKEEEDRRTLLASSSSSYQNRLSQPSTSTSETVKSGESSTAGESIPSTSNQTSNPGSSSGSIRGATTVNTSNWGKPSPSSPCHRFMSHTAHAAATSHAPAPTSSARNTIKIARGIKCWVMKRSALSKFSLDKS